MGNHGAINEGPASARVAAVRGLVLAAVEAVAGGDLNAGVAAAKALVVFLERLVAGSADEQTGAGNDNGTMATLAGPGSKFHFAAQSELRQRLMAAGTALLGGPGSLPPRGSHRSVRAQFGHTAPQVTASLRGRPSGQLAVLAAGTLSRSRPFGPR